MREIRLREILWTFVLVMTLYHLGHICSILYCDERSDWDLDDSARTGVRLSWQDGSFHLSFLDFVCRQCYEGDPAEKSS